MVDLVPGPWTFIEGDMKRATRQIAHVACLFIQRKSHERECRPWLLSTCWWNHRESQGALISRLAKFV